MEVLKRTPKSKEPMQNPLRPLVSKLAYNKSKYDENYDKIFGEKKEEDNE